MTNDDRLQYAKALYERAVFHGEQDGLAVADRHLDGVEADLALARGRVIHARFLAGPETDPAAGPETGREAGPQELALFERAAELYRALGDGRGEGEARLWIGLFHQVVRDDDAAAVPEFERALELSGTAGDRLTLSYVLRHLGFAAHRAGRLDDAHRQLSESTRLRQKLDFQPGIAANLVGLSYVAAAQGHQDEAIAHANRAIAVATASGATTILRMAEEARAAS